MKINVPQLASEFVIVFVGVALALAADSWRESLSEKRLETDYLRRVVADLEMGFQSVSNNMVRVDQAGQAATRLRAYLNGKHVYADETGIFLDITYAAETGGRGLAWPHATTYEELVSTGRLNLISDPSLREAISRYYRAANFAITIRESIPVLILDRYAAITAFSVRGLSRGGPDSILERLDADSRAAILAELQDEAIVRELALTASRCESLAGEVSDLLELNRELSARILESLES